MQSQSYAGKRRAAKDHRTRKSETRVLPATLSPTAQTRQRLASVVNRTQNAPLVSTHCGPVHGKSSQSRVPTQGKASSGCSLTRLVEQSRLPARQQHSPSSRPFGANQFLRRCPLLSGRALSSAHEWSSRLSLFPLSQARRPVLAVSSFAR